MSNLIVWFLLLSMQLLRSIRLTVLEILSIISNFNQISPYRYLPVRGFLF